MYKNSFTADCVQCILYKTSYFKFVSFNKTKKQTKTTKKTNKLEFIKVKPKQHKVQLQFG